MIAAVRACSEQLEFGIRSVSRSVRDLTPEQLAFVPPGFGNSIAALLLHIGATEASVASLLAGREVPADVRQAVLLDRYQPAVGSPIAAADPGETTESLLAKLQRARAELVTALEELTEADLDRTLPFGDKPMPVPFFLNLLPFHIASHYGQIQIIKRFLK